MMKRFLMFSRIVAGLLVLTCWPQLLPAQFLYFGRNKVQYTNFQWKVLRTTHFDIYYYPEMEKLAEIGASFAEQSFAYLENKFNFTINRRIPLIFYSSHLHFQQTNITPGLIPEGVGGFFEFLKGRVVIPADGNLNQFRKVIQHELVHVFMHSKVYFVNKEHSRFDGAYPPLWFTEGLAEYWSGGWDYQADMVLKDAVLNNYIVPLSRLYTIAGSFMMYKEGQAILQYIARHYGEEKILLLMENIWKDNKFSRVFQQVIGKSYKEFDREWLYALKKRYYPQLAREDFSSMIARTIVAKGYNFKPAYYAAPDGEKVVFVANRTGYSNIYMADIPPEGKPHKEKVRVLIEGERSSKFETFHLFSSKIDVNGQGLLVFSSKSGEQDALYIYDIQKDRIIHRFQWKSIVGIYSPAFSPDGHRVAFSGLSFSGQKDLYLVDISNGQLMQLTNDMYEDRAPSFSPDGQKIAFSSDRTMFGNEWCYNIFVYDLPTGLIHYVTSGPYRDYTPAWSPDGRYIAFTSDRDTTLNIWLADVSRVGQWDGSAYQRVQVRQLSFFANAAFDPEWVDANRMLFAVYEQNRFQIRLLDQIQQRLAKRPYIVQNTPIVNHRHWIPATLSGKKSWSKLRYKKKYNLDFAQSQVSQNPFWGTTGGAYFAFTDMLGNDQFNVLVYNNAQTRSDFLKSFNFAVSHWSLGKRTNYGFGVYRFAGRFFNFKDSFFFEEQFGGFFSLSYPFSQFKRIEFSTNLSYSNKQVIGYPERRAYLTSAWISYIHDNSIWGFTGPIDGQRYNITIGNTYDFRYSNVNYYTVLFDYRRYFRLSPKLTYAVRFLTLWNNGKEARWYYLGGSWDMRGYRRWSIRGEKIVFMSQELRFPFIDYLALHFPFGGLGFRAIRGAIFLDAGNAWNDHFPGLIGSTGFGFRLNMGGFLVLRLDFGRRTNFKRFTSGWFTQFFFGWDF